MNAPDTPATAAGDILKERRKVAVVTGASSGLGSDFVRQLDLKEPPDEIWVIARRRERLEQLQESVRTPLRILPWDLTLPESLSRYSELLEQENPVITVLINAAGFGKIGGWKEISAEQCEQMMDLNCRAAVSITRRSLDYMGKGSRILEICSTAAFQPFQYLNLYAASKALLYRYARALQVELLGTGIHVTAVCPYWIRDTEFIRTARETESRRSIRNFPLASRSKRVAARALQDSRLHLPVSTPGIVCFVHRIAAKFIPHDLMMSVWGIIRRI